MLTKEPGEDSYMKLMTLWSIRRPETKTLPLQVITLSHEFSKEVGDIAPIEKKIGSWGEKLFLCLSHKYTYST